MLGKRSREQTDGTWTCRKCKQNLTKDRFGVLQRTGKPRSYCLVCEDSLRKNDVKKSPEKHRDSSLRATYGISLEEYKNILEKQKGVCASCGHPETRMSFGKISRLAIDHDHSCCPGQKSCGKCVKGLLCCRCNMTLGLLENSPEIVQKLLDYCLKTRIEVIPHDGS